MFINNDGGGFSDTIEIAEGTTAGELFEDRFPDCDAANYRIRVNRLPVCANEVLKEGDRVSMTPTNIEGASAS
jgi:hypothetical protein